MGLDGRCLGDGGEREVQEMYGIHASTECNTAAALGKQGNLARPHQVSRNPKRTSDIYRVLLPSNWLVLCHQAACLGEAWTGLETCSLRFLLLETERSFVVPKVEECGNFRPETGDTVTPTHTAMTVIRKAIKIVGPPAANKSSVR